MLKLKFPHFTRIKTARLLSYGGNTILWTGLTVFFLLNVFAKINLTPAFQKELLQVLQKPFLALTHEGLAYRFWQLGILSAARQELLLAQDFPKKNYTGVLGASTEDELTAWASEPVRAKASYGYWKTVIAAKPDFRDAYISLAAAAYQLGFTNEAKVAAQTALNLNPDSPDLSRLIEFLGKIK